jgi:hypothetical protein
MSFIHLLSKSFIHILSLPGISSVKVLILSRASHPSSLPSWCSNLQAFLSSVSSSRLFFLTFKDFGFDACCCFLELVRRFVPLLLLLLLLQSKKIPSSGAQGGCFCVFLWGGLQISPPLFFLSWCLEFCFFPFGSGLCFENLHFDFLHLVTLICYFVCFGELLLLLWDLERFHAFVQVLLGFGF